MMAHAILALAFIGQAPSVEKAKLEVYEDYDRITDRTRLVVELGDVTPGDRPLSLRVLTEFEGKGRAKPIGSVALIFGQAADEWRYLRSNDLALLFDGNRLRFKSEHQGKIAVGYVAEIVTTIIPGADFKRLSSSRSIEAKLGSTGFTLSEPQIAALRSFSECIDNPALDPGKARRDADAKAATAKMAELANQRAKQGAAIEASEKMLAEARALDRASKGVKAMELYRSIVVKYPDTPAAKAADARFKAMMKAKKR